MKAYLILSFIVFAYSLPNQVYVIKECFEKLYNAEENSELTKSVNDELLQWKVKEFYDKVDAVDPTLRPKIEGCVEDANKHYYSHINKRRRTRSPEVRSQYIRRPIPIPVDIRQNINRPIPVVIKQNPSRPIPVVIKQNPSRPILSPEVRKQNPSRRAPPLEVISKNIIHPIPVPEVRNQKPRRYVPPPPEVLEVKSKIPSNHVLAPEVKSQKASRRVPASKDKKGKPRLRDPPPKHKKNKPNYLD